MKKDRGIVKKNGPMHSQNKKIWYLVNAYFAYGAYMHFS